MGAQSRSNPQIAGQALDQLRKHRVYPDRARGLEADLMRELKTLKKITSSESSAIEAWNAVIPDSIADSSSVGGLKAGKLVVHVPSAAQRYLVDRWLKSGGFSSFQALARVPVRGVQLVIAPLDDEKADS